MLVCIDVVVDVFKWVKWDCLLYCMVSDRNVYKIWNSEGDIGSVI